jgi:predicted nucleic acid-binding protein
VGAGGEPIAPARPRWDLLVLDSGGLTAAADYDAKARGVLDVSRRAGARVVVPAIVIAESTRGDPADAAVNRVVNALPVVPVDEEAAREAARLKRGAGMAGVAHTIDALVVAGASLAGGGAIITSDVDDISALAAVRPELVIVPIRV